MKFGLNKHLLEAIESVINRTICNNNNNKRLLLAIKLGCVFLLNYLEHPSSLRIRCLSEAIT